LLLGPLLWSCGSVMAERTNGWQRRIGNWGCAPLITSVCIKDLCYSRKEAWLEDHFGFGGGVLKNRRLAWVGWERGAQRARRTFLSIPLSGLGFHFLVLGGGREIYALGRTSIFGIPFDRSFIAIC
jgi:hypothetical protein